MLREKLERLNSRIDEIALRKRLEIEAEHLKRIKCTKIVRIFTSFTRSGFKINTRVLNDMANEEKTQFWDLVKRVCVCFNTHITNEPVVASSHDASLGPVPDHSLSKETFSNGRLFEWTRSSDADGFIMPLAEDCNNVQVLIKLQNHRQVFKLSKGLRTLLNKYSDTRQNVVKDLYRYVNSNKLNDYATSNVACDEALEKIFRVKSFNFNNLNAMIDPMLEPIGYCVIDVEMGKDQIWDIELEADDLGQMPVLYPGNVQQIEKKIEDNKVLKKRIADRMALLEEFVEDPALFINRMVALESDGVGTRTVFYDDLAVQTALYELIKKKE